MSLKYNVVVIDDQKLLFESYKEIIDQFLDENGFVADVEYFPSAEEFDAYPLGKADLFLVDLKFGRENKGQIIIEKIRANDLTDILFYSSDHDAIEQFRLDLGSQGIFFAERDELNDEVEPLLHRLLEKMISKSNTPRTTRGLVMECVAEIDDQIKEKILLLYDCLSPEEKDKYLSKIVKKIKQSNDSKMNKLRDFFGVDFANKIESVVPARNDFLIGDLIENIHVTDSNKNLTFLLTLYKMLKGKDEIYQKLAEYETLLGRRNILAHVSQTRDGDYYIFKARASGQSNYTLTEEECLGLRQTILSLSRTVNLICA